MFFSERWVQSVLRHNYSTGNNTCEDDNKTRDNKTSDNRTRDNIARDNIARDNRTRDNRTRETNQEVWTQLTSDTFNLMKYILVIYMTLYITYCVIT